MKYTPYNAQKFKESKYYDYLPKEEKEVFEILSAVFHFKTNNYILEQLIDWDTIPTNPIYRLLFLRKEMLPEEDYDRFKLLLEMGKSTKELEAFAKAWHIEKRVFPKFKLPKYCETMKGSCSDFETIISLFPKCMMQTCHAFCSYCFRWPIFGRKDIRQRSTYTNPESAIKYLKKHPEVKDALFTGADPMTTNARLLEKYIAPLLDLESITTIRISTKSLSYWPYRFTTDKGAEDILRFFEKVKAKGKHLSLIAHVTHADELKTEAVKQATERIQNTGAVIRCQGPVVKGINDTPQAWSDMWTQQLKLGMIPYYMFMEAKHHPTNCFRVPLAKALNIFQEAQKLTSGTARTVRGPVFMFDVNRVLIDGTTVLNGEKYFVLKSLQAAPGTPSEGRIKLVPYDEEATDVGNLFELFNPELVGEGACVV